MNEITLAEFKGAKLHVLFALYRAQRTCIGPVGMAWLCEMTGYGKEAVHEALVSLMDGPEPIVERVRRYRGWRLAVFRWRWIIFCLRPLTSPKMR